VEQTTRAKEEATKEIDILIEKVVSTQCNYSRILKETAPSILLNLTNTIVILSVPLFLLRPGSQPFDMLYDALHDLMSHLGVEIAYNNKPYELAMWVLFVAPILYISVRNVFYVIRRIKIDLERHRFVYRIRNRKVSADGLRADTKDRLKLKTAKPQQEE
jgi:hypothetical protein